MTKIVNLEVNIPMIVTEGVVFKLNDKGQIEILQKESK